MKGSIVEEFELSTYDIVQSPSDYNAMLGGIVEAIEKPIVEKQGQKLCEGECPIKEPKKPKKQFSKLVEAFKNYTKSEETVSEAERKAKELLEVMKRKSPNTKGDGTDAAIKQFWAGANNLKKYLGDKKKVAQFSSALDDIADIIEEGK